MGNLFKNAVGLSREIRRCKIREGDTVVDATMGNGHDTELLAELVGETGKVYAFDIQLLAIENTNTRLKELGFEDRAELILDGHENIDIHIKEKVKFIIYNLGYLPKGDHTITTNSNTTIGSIEKGLNLLQLGGMILVVMYPGHESGLLEKLAIEDFSSALNQKEFSVASIRFINQVNNPPEIICIEKLESKKAKKN